MTRGSQGARRSARAGRWWAGAVTVLAVSVAAACTGENAFPRRGGSSTMVLTGPSVDLTAPTPGTSATLGDSLEVVAVVNAPAGATRLEITGTFGDASAGFTGRTFSLGNVVDTTVTTSLGPSGTETTGQVTILATLTDAQNSTATDQVSISIVP